VHRVIRPLLSIGLLMGLVLSGTAMAPLAVAEPSAGPTDSPSASSSAGPTDDAGTAADDAANLTTRITRSPVNPSTSGRATFRWEANVPFSSGVRFRCRLSGPGHPTTTRVGSCPAKEADQTSTTKTTGTRTFTGLKASHSAYRFTVQAYIPATGTDPEQGGKSDTVTWHVFSVWAPGADRLRNGASFNRPLTRSAQRTNLTRVIRTINAMPGYRQAYPGLCPNNPAFVPGIIHISLYSMTDHRFAAAMAAARRRCLSVQILMNNHLNRSNDAAWRLLENSLGTKVFDPDGTPRRTFAHRCNFSCRGHGVLHTKMYLFNSTLRDARRNKIRNTVLVGSSNMTSNASKVQWNDLFAQRGNAGLFATYSGMFNKMKLDNGFHPESGTRTNGPFRTTFMPQRSTKDPYLKALGAVRCTGANGGTGFHGRTVVNINMHAWFGTRGMALANKVRSLYGHGCYVRVLYSFMSFKVFKKLQRGTSSRMQVRRTIFSHNGRTAYIYSHFKNIDISGRVGSDRSAKVVYTGSNNFTNDGLGRFDEVIMRIESASAYRSYTRQFAYIRKRLSSATYANFSEPTGGGRAPDEPKAVNGKAAAGAPVGTPTIVSPDVRVDDDGQPHALD
jgi:hypothetical protein